MKSLVVVLLLLYFSGIAASCIVARGRNGEGGRFVDTGRVRVVRRTMTIVSARERSRADTCYCCTNNIPQTRHS